MRNASRTTVLLALGLLATTALAGCSSRSGTFDDHWTDARSMQASDDHYLVPSLVEPDARDIRLRNAATGTGTQIGWSSAAGVERRDCRPGALTGTSRLGASWWPSHVPASGWTCGHWSVFEQGGRYYAWDRREA